MTPTTVYLRDASWWNRPDTYWPKRYHRPSTVAGAECMAACDPNRIMLNESTAELSTRVSVRSLCLRCFRVNVSPTNDVDRSERVTPQ